MKALFNCGEQKVTIYNDKSALRIACSENISARTRHIGVRIQFVRENVQNGNIYLEHMSTKLMPTDILTKSLNRQKHEGCEGRLGFSSV